MTGYVIRRILWIIPVLWAVATVTFFLMHAVEGGPFDREKELPEAVKANLAAKYNLDKPLVEQYGLFLWNMVEPITYDKVLGVGLGPGKLAGPKLDLGVSFENGRQVNTIISEGLTVSVQLGMTAFLYAVVVGMTLGVVAALNHNRFLDYLSVFFSTAGTAMPNFIIAVFLVVIFSVQLGWFDVLGWEFGNYRKMVLPIISLGTLPAAYIARITRASVLEVLGQDYIRTARAKGLQEWVVVLRHTIKNSMVPILTVMGPIFAFLVTGSFIVERVFAINGVGRHFVTAIGSRDYGVIMGTTIFFATVVAFANLIVDITYAWSDPRIRYK
ncbi:MAG: ABC transporter permease [Chloroflexi bacterium]|nr:ABC transporter permease [Chloroflexota bacterium]